MGMQLHPLVQVSGFLESFQRCLGLGGMGVRNVLKQEGEENRNGRKRNGGEGGEEKGEEKR